MKESSKIAVLFIVSVIIASTFVYLGSLLKYPDNIVIAAAGVLFATVFALVLYFNTGRAEY